MGNSTVQISHLENIQWVAGNTLLPNGRKAIPLPDTSSDVWRIRISEHAKNLNEYGLSLSADEHGRAARYYREQDKQRFIVSRAALRMLLGGYLQLDPKQIAFETGSNKKPRVKGNDNLHYNVSHSGDIALIGFSSSDIGVDVEQPDLNLHHDEIMHISYGKPEIDIVNSSADPIQTFYRVWTRKEALLKATAKGIDDGLKFIPGIDGHHATMFNTIGSDKNWIVQSFKVDELHMGCVASAFVGVNFREFNIL